MKSVFTHPETGEREVFFTNCKRQDFEDMPFGSKRIGNAAYDGEGDLLDAKDWYPVFLSEEEVEKTGKTLAVLRREWWESASPKNS